MTKNAKVHARIAVAMVKHASVVQLATMVSCVTSSVQDIVLESNASNLLILQTVLVGVQLVTMV